MPERCGGPPRFLVVAAARRSCSSGLGAAGRGRAWGASRRAAFARRRRGGPRGRPPGPPAGRGGGRFDASRRAVQAAADQAAALPEARDALRRRPQRPGRAVPAPRSQQGARRTRPRPPCTPCPSRRWRGPGPPPTCEGWRRGSEPRAAFMSSRAASPRSSSPCAHRGRAAAPWGWPRPRPPCAWSATSRTSTCATSTASRATTPPARRLRRRARRGRGPRPEGPPRLPGAARPRRAGPGRCLAARASPRRAAHARRARAPAGARRRPSSAPALLAIAFGDGRDLLVLAGAPGARCALRRRAPRGPPWPLAAPWVAAPGREPPSSAPPGASLLATLWALLAGRCLCRAGPARAPARPSLLGCGLAHPSGPARPGLHLRPDRPGGRREPLDLAAFSLLPRAPPISPPRPPCSCSWPRPSSLLVAVLCLGGPAPRTAQRAARALARSGALVGIGGRTCSGPGASWACRWCPRCSSSWPPRSSRGPHDRWRAALDGGSSAGARAGSPWSAVAGLSLLLHPTLVHFGEKEQRRRIEGAYAALVRDQDGLAGRPAARRAARDRRPAGAGGDDRPAGLPARRSWPSRSGRTRGLSGAGIASAVEVQDRSGAVISRFALDLPALLATAPRAPAPGRRSGR